MTNEAVEFPKGFRPKGKITIELFCCESGRKLQEIKNTNFIAKGVDYIYEARMRDLFTRSRATGGHDFSGIFADPFNQMMLTTADHDEDPENEWLVDGETIGFANTTGTYSGNSTTQGSYNTSESFTNEEQVHMVFDFPTHAANGTFQSIYFKPSPDGVYIGGVKKGFSTSHNKYTEYNGYIYSSLGNVMYKYNQELEIVDEISTGNVSLTDFFIYGGNLYTLSSREIRVISLDSLLDGSSDFESIKTMDTSCHGICFDEDKRVVYVSLDNKDIISMDYDDNFNILEVVGVIPSNVTSSYMKLFLIDGRIFYNGGYYTEEFNRISTSNIESSYRDSVIYGEVNNKLVVGPYRNDRNRYLYPKIHIGSRCKLDAPVTKTENTTMKVTYDFSLPEMWSI